MANRDKGFIYDDDNLTVKEYLDRWLSDSVRGTVRESTYSRDKYLVTNHVRPALGLVKLKNLNAMHLQRLYREKLEDGHSPRTVQYIHVTLHKALKQAVDDGLHRWTHPVDGPRGAGGAAGKAVRDHPERHPQGVHGPQHLHLPARAVDADHLRHLRLHVGAHAEVQLDLDLRLSHAGGRSNSCSGNGLHAC